MRTFLFIITLTVSKTFGQTGIVSKTLDDFSKIKYDKVVAFNYNFDSITNKKKPARPLVINDKNFRFVKKCSVRHLNGEQVNSLFKTLKDTATFGQQYADCFEPRHGIAFLKDEKLVFLIEICFDCGFLESTIPIKAAYQKYYDIDGLKDENGKEYFHRRYLKGFSKKGFKAFHDLCKDLGMIYCPDVNQD